MCEAGVVLGRNLDAAPGLLYADDLAIGDWMDLGVVSASEAEIIAFARQFDPLPLHVDRDAAAQSPFGGIIASAIHTLALFASLASTRFLPRLALVAGKGMESARFPAPVRPDELLRGRMEVVGVALREGRADVRSRATMTSDAGVVLDFVSITVVRTLG
jgi:acyl dehydratase